MEKQEFVDKMLDGIDPKYIEEPVHKGHRVLRLFLKWLVPVLIILVFFVLLIPIHVSRQCKCIEIKLDDPSYQRECTITIDGYYHINLFCSDSFSGKFTVSLYRQTMADLSPLSIQSSGTPVLYSRIITDSRDRDVNGGIHDPSDSSSMEQTSIVEQFRLGHLKAKWLFRKFVICVYSDNITADSSGWKQSQDMSDWGTWNAEAGYCIVPDCMDYESARKYLAEMGIISLD